MMFDFRRSERGFTLIELLVVVAIIALLSSVVMASLNSARQKSRNAKRVQDLRQMQTALEMYYDSNGSYPNSGGSWRSQCPTYGGYAANSVIPGLIPTYMPSMPVDPYMNTSVSPNTGCYLYLSDGIDYAILDHNSSDIDYTKFPLLIDPARDGGSNGCAVDGTGIWSWKVSSPGGRCW